MKNKHLLAIFLGLLFVFLTAQFLFEKKARRFELDLVQLDTSAITSLKIYPKEDQQVPFSLEREAQFWAASKENITFQVNPTKVHALLVQLSRISSDSIVAKEATDWAKFEITPELGIRIQVYSGKKMLEDFYVGRFDVDLNTQQFTSYLRFTGAKEVYATRSELGKYAPKSFTTYRNRSILYPEISAIEQITLQSGGEEKSFNKTSVGWVHNKEVVDSLKMTNYLNQLEKVVGANFVDNFDEVRQSELLYGTLHLAYSHLPDPVVIKAYRDSSRTLPFILHASINKDSYFSSGEDGMFETLFGLEDLLD
ncbi:MAG: DUF4340 domain-containing protein [Bacteroidota bacterium]